MKLNKSLAITAVAACTLFAGNFALRAQDDTNSAPATATHRDNMKRRGPDLEKMATDLGLSDDQKTKVKAAFDEQQKKIQDLRSDSDLSSTDRRAKMKDIRKATNAQLKDILTPDQYAKWEKMMPAGRNRRAPVSETNTNLP